MNFTDDIYSIENVVPGSSASPGILLKMSTLKIYK